MEQFDTVVVGGGQAGLALGYYLRQQRRDFVILEAGNRVGESWRSRWDSLRLFTPARMDGLPGMRFPAPDGYFPTKDEMADYLEAYAARFRLPVRQNTRVNRLTQSGEQYTLDVGPQRIMSDRVVVATGPFQRPNVPAFAAELSRSIFQVHSSAYRNPSQLPSGAVLVVGAGNSGAEIAVELASTGRRVILSGRDTGHVPGGLLGGYNPGRSPGRSLVGGIAWTVVWWLVTRALTADTWLGREVMGFRQGRTSGPLIRLEPGDILDAGVERVPRIEGVAGGRPRLTDGRTLDVAAVIWATGFRPDFGWINLPIFDKDGYPIHHRGVVAGRPGLYFLGLPFQHTLVSEMIAGAVYDARYVAEHIRTRAEPGETATRPACTPGNRAAAASKGAADERPARAGSLAASAMPVGSVVGGSLAGLLGLAAALHLGARRWRRRTEARLRAGSVVTSTAQGPVEYTVAGEGRPVLMFHATPGGYDQGVTLANLFGSRGLRVIAISRPGYLRTPLATGRSPAEQAAAAAALLDSLGVRKAAVVGVSGGGPSAIQFGVRHPSRLSRLVLWQAVIRRTPMEIGTLDRLVGGFMTTDLGAWLVLNAIKIAPRLALPTRLGSDLRMRARMRALIETFFPLDLRRDGILNDARQNAALPDFPLQEITAPTLIVHGSADRTVPHAQAEAAARAIPNARLVSVPNGTHETTFVAPGALAAIAMHLSAGKDLPVRNTLSVRGRWSALSAFSVLSVASAASVLSVGSFASILSIGSAASILSIGSTGSILCVGSAGDFLRVGGRHRRSQTGAQEARGAPTVVPLIPR